MFPVLVGPCARRGVGLVRRVKLEMFHSAHSLPVHGMGSARTERKVFARHLTVVGRSVPMRGRCTDRRRRWAVVLVGLFSTALAPRAHGALHDCEHWVQLLPTAHPQPRYGHAMVRPATRSGA